MSNDKYVDSYIYLLILYFKSYINIYTDNEFEESNLGTKMHIDLMNSTNYFKTWVYSTSFKIIIMNRGSCFIEYVKRVVEKR